MNIKLILTAVLVTVVTFGLQAATFGGSREAVAQRMSTAKPAAVRPVSTQTKQAAVAPKTSTVTQQKAALTTNRSALANTNPRLSNTAAGRTSFLQ